MPVHSAYNVQDWDDAPGAIDWPRLRSFLKEIKQTGVIPGSHKSHDHLNEQVPVPLTPELFSRWQAVFEDAIKKAEVNEDKIIFGLVDGFLLYWDDVSNHLCIYTVLFNDFTHALLFIIVVFVVGSDMFPRCPPITSCASRRTPKTTE